MKYRIFVILTGGTILMKRDDEGSGLIPGDITPLSSILRPFENEFSFMYNSLFNLDSSNIQPEHWQQLSQEIYNNYRHFDGFLILHGTDTMAYTASALSFMLRGLKKPVVFTGSQLPLMDPASDGYSNIINALRVIKTGRSGVMIVFGSEIIRGTRAKKVSSYELQAFHSVNEIPLGNIGLTIRWNHCFKRERGAFRLLKGLDISVALVKIYPGFRVDALNFYIDNGYRGIVLESYGSGNVPDSFRPLIPAIERANEQGIVIIIVSQCVMGHADLSLYHLGRVALKAGAISGLDMTPETALVKLMWALGNFDDPRGVITSEIAGEFSPEV